ncbi:MAG: alpha-L-fucosidase [Armatimonadota bacterium]
MNRRTVLMGAAAGLGAAALQRAAASQPAPGTPGTVPTPAPRIARFERMGFGMFVHWGLYSQLGRGEWAKHFQKLPTDEYMKLMKTFTAKDFRGRDYARLAKQAGMKYITLTSRHHDGFSLYDTRGLSPYDVTHTPAKRDLVRDFVEGCRAEGVMPMLYHTTLDWTEPRFEKDFPAYLQYLRDSIELLCTRYGKLGGLWFDGNWSKQNTDWQESQLYALIRKHQPEALIINNTGISEGGRVGHPEIDSVTFERGRPKPLDRRGHPKYVAAEMCHTMNFHWGLAQNDFNMLSPAHVIEELCLARRAGANLLMNLGPEAQGKLPEYESAAFRRVGEWIRLHGGDAGPIYQGRATRISGDGDDFALELDGDLYLFVLHLTATANTQAHDSGARGPGKRTFRGVEGSYGSAEWIDNGEKLKLEQDSGAKQLTLHATAYPYGTNTVVRVARLRKS